MAVRVRLLELQNEADSLAAGRAAGRMLPESNLRGWAALVPLSPALIAAGLREAGLVVLAGDLAALALGNLAQLWAAGRSLSDALTQPEAKSIAAELSARAAAIETAACGPGLGAAGRSDLPRWTLPRSVLAHGRTLVMGIVNVTPDSFSDGGRFLDPARAIEHGLALVREGCDLLDIGGESTNPFVSQPIDAAEELRRVLPVVRELALRAGVPISIDTSKAEVAEAALANGAEVVNDVSGLARDPRLGRVCAEQGAALCLMHMRGTAQEMNARARYDDLHGEVAAELDASLSRALEAGVDPERIILDPGLGFAKTAAHNFALLRRLRELLQLGRPLLVGASRKSFLGKATGKAAPDRLYGSIAAAALAAMSGAAVIRVHDVAQTREALAVADAVRTTTTT